MGLLDLFRKPTEKTDESDLLNYIVKDMHGNMEKAKELLRDHGDMFRFRKAIDDHYDNLYDLYSVKGIERIPVKAYKYLPIKSNSPVETSVGNIEYVLRMRAGQHYTNKRIDLAIACLRKSRDISPISNGDMRLVKYLLYDGQFEEAKKEWQITKDLVFRFGNFDVCKEEWFEAEKQKEITRKIFEHVQEILPDIAPKSFSGYMRMKNAQSKNWLKLVAAAEEKGIELE